MLIVRQVTDGSQDWSSHSLVPIEALSLTQVMSVFVQLLKVDAIDLVDLVTMDIGR